jgi:hypothetical protein
LVAKPENLLRVLPIVVVHNQADATIRGRYQLCVKGSEADIAAASDRLLAGYEAFCSRNNGKIGKSDGTPGQRCVNASGQVLAPAWG